MNDQKPRFELCDVCSLHGRIIDQEGAPWGEIYNREYILISAVAAVHYNIFTAEDARAVSESASMVSLPEGPFDASAIARLRCHAWNSWMEQRQMRLDPRHFHDFLECPN